jgi:hypothetical protein
MIKNGVVRFSNPGMDWADSNGLSICLSVLFSETKKGGGGTNAAQNLPVATALLY